MPSSIISSFAKKAGKNEKDVENLWNTISGDIEKSSPNMKDTEKYQEVVGTLKKQLKIETFNPLDEEAEVINIPKKGLVRITQGPFKGLLGYMMGDVGDEKEIKLFGSNLAKKKQILKKIGTVEIDPYLYISPKELEMVKESMEIDENVSYPKIINFKYIQGTETFDNTTKEYRELEKIDSSGDWEKYYEEMISQGTEVTYDNVEDEYIVKEVGAGIEEDATLSNDIAVMPKRFPQTIRRKDIEKESQEFENGIPIFEVSMSEISKAAKIRRDGSIYKIGDEKVREYIRENGRRPVILKNGDYKIKVKC